MKKRFAPLAALAVTAVMVTAGTATASTAPAPKTHYTIVDIAAGAPQYSTLVSLVKKAGLVKVLSGKGPYTVLAPTNATFAKVPKSTLDALAKDKAALRQVLTYHVISGKVTSKQVVKLNGKEVRTVEGSPVSINVKPGGSVWFTKSAKVIRPDIMTSNGVIHGISRVLLPPTLKIG